MKKINFLMIVIGITILVSCDNASNKVAGNYSGTYTFTGQNAGTANVTTATDKTVNMALFCSGLNINATANGVNAVFSDDNVKVTYNSPTATAGEIIEIDGLLTGNSLSFNWKVSTGIGNNSGSFTGNK